MKRGDLVTVSDSLLDRAYAPGPVGVVVEVKHWVDKGAPDRNFGTDIKVLWSDGSVGLYDPYELQAISD